MSVDVAELGIVVELKNGQLVTRQLQEIEREGAKLEQTTSKLAGTTVASTRSLDAWSALQAEASGHVGEHSLAIGRLERMLASYTGEAVGANHITEALGASFLKFGIGSVETVGVLAGIAAIIAVYDKLTEASRKVREESDKAAEAVEKMIRLKKLGTAPDLKEQNNALIAQINNYSAQLSRNARGEAAARNTPMGASDQTERDAEVARIVAARQHLRDLVRANNAEIAQDEIKYVNTQQEQQVREIANLVKSNTAKAEQYQNGLALLKSFQDRLKTATSLDERSWLTTQIKELTDSYFPKLSHEVDELARKIRELPKVDIGPTDTKRMEEIGQNFNIGKFGGVPLTATFNKDNVPVQIPDEALKKFFEEFNKGVSERRDEGLKEEQDALKKSAKTAIAHSEAMAKAAQVVGQAVEYYIVQRVGGGGAGANIGASIAKGAFTDAAANGVFGTSFASTALGAAVFAPLVAGAGAAAGGLLDFVVGLSNAKEQLRQMQEQAHQVALNARIDAQGFTTLQQALEQIDIEERKRLQALQEAGYSQEELDARRQQVYEDAALKRRRTEEAYAERARHASEDLEVRALRAKGRSREADALDLENRQKAEIAAAQAQGMSDEYIARLKEVQAIEKTTAALARMNSFLNVPPGFKYNSLIFQNSPARDYTPQFPIDIPYTPTGRPDTTGGAIKSSGDLTVNVTLADGTVIGGVVLKDFKKRAQKQYGDSARWGEIQ